MEFSLGLMQIANFMRFYLEREVPVLVNCTVLFVSPINVGNLLAALQAMWSVAVLLNRN